MRNAIEHTVRDIATELRRRSPEFCSCEQCDRDAVTMALNLVRPRYVSEIPPLGAAVVEAELSRDQVRAELTVVVYEALRRVAAAPRHDRPSGATDSDAVA